MGTLPLFPSSLAASLRPSTSNSRTYFSNPIFCPHVATTLKSRGSPSRTVAVGSSKNDPKESRFLDSNGVVDDMDGYLNYLSLEYDSVWDTKPSWCQPWTIVLTGVSMIGGSWLILHSIVVSVIVFLLIFTWWYIFLYSYPKAYSEMIAERRKRVTNGVEDTFGFGRGNELN